MLDRMLRPACFALLAVLLGADQAATQAPPSVPIAAEKAAIDTCLAKMPPKVQVAIALLQGDTMRFLGAERSDASVHLIDNRSAVFRSGSRCRVAVASR